jgi:hypothetical protein
LNNNVLYLNSKNGSFSNKKVSPKEISSFFNVDVDTFNKNNKYGFYDRDQDGKIDIFKVESGHPHQFKTKKRYLTSFISHFGSKIDVNYQFKNDNPVVKQVQYHGDSETDEDDEARTFEYIEKMVNPIYFSVPMYSKTRETFTSPQSEPQIIEKIYGANPEKAVERPEFKILSGKIVSKIVKNSIDSPTQSRKTDFIYSLAGNSKRGYYIYPRKTTDTITTNDRERQSVKLKYIKSRKKWLPDQISTTVKHSNSEKEVKRSKSYKKMGENYLHRLTSEIIFDNDSNTKDSVVLEYDQNGDMKTYSSYKDKYRFERNKNGLIKKIFKGHTLMNEATHLPGTSLVTTSLSFGNIKGFRYDTLSGNLKFTQKNQENGFYYNYTPDGILKTLKDSNDVVHYSLKMPNFIESEYPILLEKTLEETIQGTTYRSKVDGMGRISKKSFSLANLATPRHYFSKGSVLVVSFLNHLILSMRH